MPVDPLDKPIAKLREETIDQLTLNYSHGELSIEAFERRLDQALDATTNAALISLTADLDLVVDSVFREQKKREFGILADSHDSMGKGKIVSIFGNSKREGLWNVPKEMQVFTIFGNTTLDFSEARLASMTTRINVSCVFGSTLCYIPEGIKVVSNVACILGGVKDTVSSSNGGDVPTIILDGFVLFGDIKIKIKKSFRERLMKFAEAVRAVFAAPAI
jgi:hypothetical protein